MAPFFSSFPAWNQAVHTLSYAELPPDPAAQVVIHGPKRRAAVTEGGYSTLHITCQYSGLIL